MVNLVPVQLDKDSGRKVLKRPQLAAPPGFKCAFGFAFTQALPASVWTITHNGDSDELVITIFNELNEVILPNEITIVDMNTVQVDFVVSQAGFANLVVFQGC